MTVWRSPLAVGAALIVVLPLVLAWRMPGLFDPSRYRAAIAAYASERLGHTVIIAGPIGLSIWPAPTLTATDVDVGGDGTTAGGFHIDALRLRVGLRSLLAGRVQARALVLRGATLRLPWPLPEPMLNRRLPNWLGAFAAQIERSRVVLGSMSAESIDATLAQTEDGVLVASGTATIRARAARFTLRLGTPDVDGAAALNVTLDGLDRLLGAGAVFAGAVAADGTLSGHLTARGTDLSQLFAVPPIAFRADGRLTVGGGLVALDEAHFDLAGAPASGAIALRLSPVARLDIALSATRLDLDPWLAALLPGDAGGLGAMALPVGVDLSVAAARLGDGIVGGLRGHAAFGAGAVVLRDVAAVLPGEARLALQGTAETGLHGEPPSFAGTIRLDAPALRTTLAWLAEMGWPVPAFPSAVLNQAAIAGRLRLRPGSLSLESLTGRVDGATVAGGIALRDGTHPSAALDLAIDRLALDPWLPDDLATKGRVATGGWVAIEDWPAAIAQRRTGLAMLASGRTMRVAVHAAHAVLRGVPIGGLTVDATLAPDGALTLRSLAATAFGLDVQASGALAADGAVRDAALTLAGPNAAGLATLLPAGVAPPAFWRHPIGLDLRGGGPASALALRIGLDLGNARLEAQPVIDMGTSAWRSAANLRHPDATRFLASLGLPVRPAEAPDAIGAAGWLGEGSLSLLGQFSGIVAANGPARVSADSFTLTAGLLRASGHLAVSGRQVTGELTADALPVPSDAGQAPMTLSGLHGWGAAVRVRAARISAGSATLMNDATFALRLSDDVLAVDGLSGSVDGGRLTGDASLAFAAAPPRLQVAGTLSDAVIPSPADDPPVGLLSGRLDATGRLSATGYGSAAMLATLTGSVHIVARSGAVAGFDLFDAGRAVSAADSRPPAETEASLRVAAQRGTTSFDTLEMSGDAVMGQLRLTGARLQGPTGSAEAQGSIDLADNRLDIQIALRPSAADAPTIGVRIDGSVGAPETRAETAAASRWLIERRVRADAANGGTP